MDYDDYGRSIKISKPIQDFLSQCWDTTADVRPSAQRCVEFFSKEEQDAIQKNDKKNVVTQLFSSAFTKSDTI
jgi:hypothetical protein